MLAGTTNLRRLDQVEHFWDTVDTIGEGFGFSLFGARHLVTLALYIGFAALSCKLYKAADEKKRAQLRGLFAVLLLADEAFKQIGLQIGGNFNWDYLPLHLCSINIFLIALYAWKPSIHCYFFSCNAAAHIGNASILIDKLHGSNLIMSRNVVGDICKLIRYLCLSKQHGRYFSIFRNQICRYRRLWREMQFSIFHG